MNGLLLKGFGTLNTIVKKGFGKTLVVIIAPPTQPPRRENLGGGGYIELPPEPHPFRLIETKAIVVRARKKKILVKVIQDKLDVFAYFKFLKYSRIQVVFKGIEND